MPRGNRDRSPSSGVGKRRAAREPGKAPPAGMEGMHMVPDTGHHGASLAVRGDDLGLYQPRHASQ